MEILLHQDKTLMEIIRQCNLQCTPQNKMRVPIENTCRKTIPSFSRQPEACYIVPYIPLHKRAVRPGTLKDPLVAYSSNIDGILCMAEHSGFDYDYALRTDLDTFLLPGFAAWMPNTRDPLHAGVGGYASANSNAHLVSVT